MTRHDTRTTRRAFVGGIGALIAGAPIATGSSTDEQQQREPTIAGARTQQGVVDLELEDARAGDVVRVTFADSCGRWVCDLEVTERDERRQQLLKDAENLEPSDPSRWVNASIVGAEFVEIDREVVR